MTTMKANTDGTVTLTYDGSSSVQWASVSNSVCDTQSSIMSAIEEITKKPEVRVDQRSSLEIVGRQVMAYYYKDGFRTDSKDLIPAIKSVEVFNEKTVKVTFVNGDTHTATAQNGDVFSLEGGILRCIVKEMIGKEGNAILSKLLDYATGIYNKAESEKKRKAKEEAEKKAAADKNYAKLQKHFAKKRAMEREKRIQEMAEAIVRAKEMEKNV